MVKSTTGHNYKEQVYAILKKAITTHELRPGDKVSVRKLAESLNMSRTPVREAIHALRDEGWLSVKPWQGTVVRSVTKREVEEIMHLRMAIEPYAIELALPYLGERDINYLASLIEKQKHAADQDFASQFIETDKEFHSHLANITKNSRIIHIMKEMGELYSRLGIEAVQEKSRYELAIQEHITIVDALRTRDVQVSANAMRVHVHRTLEALLTWLDIKK